MLGGGDEGQERNEKPTPRRLWLARSEGKIAKSHDLTSAVGLLGGALIMSAFGLGPLVQFLHRTTRESARALTAGPLTMEGGIQLVRTTVGGYMLAILPFLLGMASLLVVASVAQTKGLWAWPLIQPKLSNIDPMTGVKRLLSFESVITLAKSILKFGVLGLVTYLTLAGRWTEMLSLPETDPRDVGSVLEGLLMRLVIFVGLAFVVIGFIDYVIARFRYEKSLRMSRVEVKEEHKDIEGDPVIKGRIRAMARAIARRRMLASVPKADVVITNPTHIAVALKYDADDAPAPIVLAMGQRKLAARIREIAIRSGVPVIENRPVARALFATCKVGKMIPPALYAAVAEILAFVYRSRARSPLGSRGAGESGGQMRRGA